MIFALAQACWAEEHVATVYFGGTGLPENGWDGDHTRWDSRSLIATLYNHDAGGTMGNPGVDNQYKVYVAGVGAPSVTGEDIEGFCNWLDGTWVEWLNDGFLQQGDPHGRVGAAFGYIWPFDEMFACRTWEHTVDEAEDLFLDNVLLEMNLAQDTLTLNVVGHSRGAIAAMWFLRRVFDYYWPVHNPIVRVNLITLDPVPGINTQNDSYKDVEEPDGSDSPIGWDTFRLSEKLTRFVSIYAQDERAKKFDAVVPYFTDNTKARMFRVRGSHQTIAGNLRRGGHAPMLSFGTYPDGFHKGQDQSLKVIPDLVGITFLKLLSGEKWGSVQFNNEGDKKKDPDDPYRLISDLCPDGLELDKCQDDFEDNVAAMNNDDLTDPKNNIDHYDRMQEGSFFPLSFPRVYKYRFNAGYDCYTGGLAVHDDHYRCIKRIEAETEVTDGLEFQNDKEDESDREFIPLLGEGITATEGWKWIRVMGSGDDDDDGWTNDVDNCPYVANPGQENENEGDDNEGDACDPVADAVVGEDHYDQECTGTEGADVQLDGGDSYDPDNQTLTYNWLVNGIPKSGVTPVYTLAQGVHDITLLVEDEDGNTDTDETVTATVRDTKAPVITGIGVPILAGPANHQYMTFKTSDFVSSVFDTCTIMSIDDLRITQVTSNEPDDAKGDGQTLADIVIATDRRSVDLRIERAGKGTGREYSIDIEAVDGTGNAITETFMVRVKHNNGS
jgi:hypothetical protein